MIPVFETFAESGKLWLWLNPLGEDEYLVMRHLSSRILALKIIILQSGISERSRLAVSIIVFKNSLRSQLYGLARAA